MEHTEQTTSVKNLLWVAEAPRGYEWVQHGGTLCLVREGYRGLLGYVSPDGRPAVQLDGPDIGPVGTGRNPTTRITLFAKGAERMVFRRCRRGAFAEKVFGDVFFGLRTRMFKEATVTTHALARGVPVAEVLVAAREPVAPLFYRGWVITREIRESQNLQTYLYEVSAAAPQDIAGKRAILRSVAEAIARLHDAGVDHPDLNLKNILVRRRPDRQLDAYVIDFDKTRVLARVDMARRIKNLLRLFRSVLKLPTSRHQLTRRDMERFLQAYFRGDHHARRAATRHLTWGLRILRLHGLWWRLTRQPSCLRQFLNRKPTPKRGGLHFGVPTPWSE